MDKKLNYLSFKEIKDISDLLESSFSIEDLQKLSEDDFREYVGKQVYREDIIIRSIMDTLQVLNKRIEKISKYLYYLDEKILLLQIDLDKNAK